MVTPCIHYLVKWTWCCLAAWWKSKWTCIFKFICVCFPSFCFFFLLLIVSTSLLSIHHDQSAGFLSRLPHTLAPLQMRIDPTVNLISMILCRAFSFTALHSAKQTWLLHDVYRLSLIGIKHFVKFEESRNIKPTYYHKQKSMLKNVHLNLTQHLSGLRFLCNRERPAIYIQWKVCI